MAKTKIDLDGRAYLFAEQPVFAPKCLISCHGFHRNGAGTYTPSPGVTLHFYCPHNQTVDDVLNVQAWRYDNPGVVDCVPSADGLITNCTNYTLTKLQESHLDIERTARSKKATYAEAEAYHGLFGETYTQLLTINLPTYDIATVRRRHALFGGDELSLSRMIELISAENQYADYYCLFCRESRP